MLPLVHTYLRYTLSNSLIQEHIQFFDRNSAGFSLDCQIRFVGFVGFEQKVLKCGFTLY